MTTAEETKRAGAARATIGACTALWLLVEAILWWGVGEHAAGVLFLWVAPSVALVIVGAVERRAPAFRRRTPAVDAREPG